MLAWPTVATAAVETSLPAVRLHSKAGIEDESFSKKDAPAEVVSAGASESQDSWKDACELLGLAFNQALHYILIAIALAKSMAIAASSPGKVSAAHLILPSSSSHHQVVIHTLDTQTECEKANEKL